MFMLTTSADFRLISPGLPAPSRQMSSYSSARESYALHTSGQKRLLAVKYSRASMLPTGRPITITWEPVLEWGLRRMGFILASGSMRQAWACTIWARPISSPRAVTPELRAIFCALNGATR